MQINHYEILEIEKQDLDKCLSENEIKVRLNNAYINLTSIWDPDEAKKWTSDLEFCREVMKRISTAYKVLIDPTTRKQYNSQLNTLLVDFSDISNDAEKEAQFRNKWLKLKQDHLTYTDKNDSVGKFLKYVVMQTSQASDQFAQLSSSLQRLADLTETFELVASELSSAKQKIIELEQKYEIEQRKNFELIKNNEDLRFQIANSKREEELKKENELLKEQIRNLKSQGQKSEVHQSDIECGILESMKVNNNAKLIPAGLIAIEKIIDSDHVGLIFLYINLIFSDENSAELFKESLGQLLQKDGNYNLTVIFNPGNHSITLVEGMKSKFGDFKGSPCVGVKILEELEKCADITNVPQIFINAQNKKEIPLEKIPAQFKSKNPELDKQNKINVNDVLSDSYENNQKARVQKIIPKKLKEIHRIISPSSGELYGAKLVFEDYESAKAFRNEVTKIFNERDSHIVLNFSGDKILSIVARMNSRFRFFEGKILGIELLKELGEYVDFTKVPQKFYNSSDNEIPNEKVPLEFR